MAGIESADGGWVNELLRLEMAEARGRSGELDGSRLIAISGGARCGNGSIVSRVVSSDLMSGVGAVGGAIGLCVGS